MFFLYSSLCSLGESFSGVFSTSDSLWSQLESAGKAEHDRFWRMPFDDTFMRQIDGTNADLCNTGGRLAGVQVFFSSCLLVLSVINRDSIVRTFSRVLLQSFCVSLWMG